MSSIEEKVEAAIRNLRFASHAAKKHGGGLLNVRYSGGKDSDVILALTKMTNRHYRVTHSLTTLDAPDTIRHIMKVKRETEKDPNCVEFVLIRPEKTFVELLEYKKMIPTRLCRYCCSELKENLRSNKGDIIVIGVRVEESAKRKDRKLFQISRNNKFIDYNLSKFSRAYTGKNKAGINPIFDWTLDDVIEFVDRYSIKLNLVYEKQGGIQTRCGCLFCPLATQKARLSDIINYPQQWQRVLRSLRYIAEWHGYDEDDDYHFAAYWMVEVGNNKELNDYICSLEQWEREKWERALRSLLGRKREIARPTTDIVDSFEDFPFMQNEIAWEKAHDPRIRICSVCKKRGKVTPEIKALNLKLHGRGVHHSQLMCIDCLAKELDTTAEKLEEKIESFKQQDCELF